MRSLGLAEEALARGWEVSLAGRIAGPAMEQAKRVQGLTLVGGGRQSLLDHLGDADVVHLDTYDPELSDLRRSGFLLSSMADALFGLRVADLTVDHSASAPGRAEVIRQRAGGEVLVGVGFAPLRSCVRSLAGAWTGSGAALPQVLVVMGGSDPLGLTGPVVEALMAVDGIGVTAVAAADRHPELQRSWANGEPESLTCLTFLNDLPATALRHDLVVSASGTSVWEFASIGLPMALVCAVGNQVDNYQTLVSQGAAIGLTSGPGSLDDVAARIAATVHSRDSLRRLSKAALGLIDSQGASRVVRSWESLLFCRPSRRRANPVTLRLAEWTDSDLLLGWRNDETSRRFSRHDDPVDKSGHEQWLESVLADPRRQLLVAEADGLALGVVRWDEEVPTHWEGRWEVSITLAPEHRGRGLAVPMLVAAEEWLTARVVGPHRLLASINVANVASTRLFARAGYLPDLEPDDQGFFRLSRSVVGRNT